MDATTTTQSVPAQSRGILRTVKIVTTLSVITGLLTTNVATLTNDAAHTSLYDGLQQILGYTPLDSFAHRLLSHSPTAVRRGDVVKATAKLTADLAAANKDHKIEIDKLDQHNRKIIAERDDWKTKHQKLTADHTDLNNKHSKLTNDHDELNKPKNLSYPIPSA